jgi:hypothetical protein
METSLKRIHHRAVELPGEQQPDQKAKTAATPDGGYQAATTELIDPRGPAHVASGGEEGRVPLGAWRFQIGDALELVSLKEKLGPHIGKREMVELARHARALKHGYPGEGETEGPKEFKDYLKRSMEKDGFVWDILRLDDRAGANVNLFAAGEGLYGAIEQGFAKKAVDPETASAFFQGAIDRLRSQGAKFVLMELNDPRLMEEEKKQEDDRRTRFRVDNAVYMAGLGMRSPDAKYGQITLNPGDEPVIHLKLGLVPTDPNVTTISCEEYLAIVKGYFSTFKIVRDEAARLGIPPAEVVERNATYREIAASVAGRTEVALLDPRKDWNLDRADYLRWSV